MLGFADDIYPLTSTRVDGSQLSGRTRRAFTFIHTLHITGPLAERDIGMLWDPALPGETQGLSIVRIRLEDRP